MKAVHKERRLYLFVLTPNQNLVNAFLTEEVIFQVVWILTGSRGRCSIHPLEFLFALFPCQFFLQALELLQLAFFFLLFAKLVKFLLFFKLFRSECKGINCSLGEAGINAYRSLLFQPHPLLILHQERVP